MYDFQSGARYIEPGGGCASNHCELNGIKKRVNFFVILILKEVVNKSWRGGGDGWIG